MNASVSISVRFNNVTEWSTGDRTISEILVDSAGQLTKRALEDDTAAWYVNLDGKRAIVRVELIEE